MTGIYCYLLLFLVHLQIYHQGLAKSGNGRLNCDKMFQQCLDKKGNIGSHKIFNTPSECNRQIMRHYGCLEISKRRYEKLPNTRGETRWRLVGRRGLVSSDSESKEVEPEPQKKIDDRLQMLSKHITVIDNLERSMDLI